MSKTVVKSIFLVGLFTLALSGQAFAKGGPGGGAGHGVNSGNSIQAATMTQTRTQSKQQQRLRDGSAVGDPTARGEFRGQGPFGVADGTDTPLAPKDGSGFGSPANRQ